MKSTLAAVAAIAVLAGSAGDADAQSRRSRTTVVESGPAVDLSTVLLLGALGGGSAAGLETVLPLLALQGSGNTTVIRERGRRRWRR